ncbi:dTDP-4-dehydrorhamnose 3,5-epimerase [Gemmatimonadota bacterium]
MIFSPLELEGAFLIKPELLQDQRGFFARTFCQREFRMHGLNPVVAQCNISYNAKRGTLRGMHYQHPDGEAKLVRCTWGRIWDVIIDLRPDSPTYCRSFGVELSTDNRLILYVPEHFAHGFLTLEGDVEVSYQMSEFYVPSQGCGVRWDDPAFAIEWPESIQVISERDQVYPDFYR